MTLLRFLYDRLRQLEHRKMMIPRYIERPHAFAGTKRDFSMNMLPGIEEEIRETKAAIKGIEEYKKAKLINHE